MGLARKSSRRAYPTKRRRHLAMCRYPGISRPKIGAASAVAPKAYRYEAGYSGGPPFTCIKIGLTPTQALGDMVRPPTGCVAACVLSDREIELPLDTVKIWRAGGLGPAVVGDQGRLTSIRREHGWSQLRAYKWIAE
jgi:hypothetical protein